MFDCIQTCSFFPFHFKYSNTPPTITTIIIFTVTLSRNGACFRLGFAPHSSTTSSPPKHCYCQFLVASRLPRLWNEAQPASYCRVCHHKVCHRRIVNTGILALRLLRKTTLWRITTRSPKLARVTTRRPLLPPITVVTLPRQGLVLSQSISFRGLSHRLLQAWRRTVRH